MSELPGPIRGRRPRKRAEEIIAEDEHPRKRIKIGQGLGQLSLEKPFIPEQLRNVLIDDHRNINNEQCQI